MRRMLGLVGAFVGGWLGWVVGSAGSFFLAFMLSVLGTGLGMYIGYRIASELS